MPRPAQVVRRVALTAEVFRLTRVRTYAAPVAGTRGRRRLSRGSSGSRAAFLPACSTKPLAALAVKPAAEVKVRQNLCSCAGDSSCCAVLIGDADAWVALRNLADGLLRVCKLGADTGLRHQGAGTAIIECAARSQRPRRWVRPLPEVHGHS